MKYSLLHIPENEPYRRLQTGLDLEEAKEACELEASIFAKLENEGLGQVRRKIVNAEHIYCVEINTMTGEAGWVTDCFVVEEDD